MKHQAQKIALISDIHGNLPALESVIEQCRRKGVQKIWNLGDITGYIPFPNDVIEILEQENAVSVVGNYDRKVISFPPKKKKWKKKKKRKKFHAFEWNSDNLTSANRKILKSLPEEVRLGIEGHRILLTHETPDSCHEALFPETFKSRFKELAVIADADIVCIGHSHIPFKKNVSNTLFVNPGSIGLPVDGRHSSYTTLEFSSDYVKVNFHTVLFDVERVKRAMDAASISLSLL